MKLVARIATGVAASGVLTRVDDFPFEGILPESLVFDNAGRMLAVANYAHFDERRRGGSIDFWRLTSDPLDPARVMLATTDHSVPVTRGVHNLAIVK